MTMPSMARRGLLRLIGAASAAMPVAPAMLSSSLAKYAPALAAATALAPSAGMAPVNSRDVHPLGRLVWDQVDALRDQLEFERYDRGQLRDHGLDHDRLWIIETSDGAFALTDYNWEITGFDPALQKLNDAVHYGGNAYYVTGALCNERGWRARHVEDRR